MLLSPRTQSLALETLHLALPPSPSLLSLSPHPPPNFISASASTPDLAAARVEALDHDRRAKAAMEKITAAPDDWDSEDQAVVYPAGCWNPHSQVSPL